MNEIKQTRGWVDLHGTWLVLPPGRQHSLYTEEGLSLSQRKNLKILAGDEDSEPDTFETDLSGILLSEKFFASVGSPYARLRSVISGQVADQWILPETPEKVPQAVQEYYQERVAPFEVSRPLIERLGLLSDSGLKLSIYTNAPWSKWGFYWRKFIKPYRDVLDSEMMAVVRPDLISQGIFFKEVVPPLRYPYEDSFLFEDDPRIISEAESYCKGFYVPYRKEDISKLPKMQQMLFEKISPDLRRKIVFETDSPKEDVERILSLIAL